MVKKWDLNHRLFRWKYHENMLVELHGGYKILGYIDWNIKLLLIIEDQ